MVNDSLMRKEQQINLIMALDAARDAISFDDDPASMFHAIIHLLKQQFNADGGAIMLVTESGQDVEMIASLSLPDKQAIDMAWQAVRLKAPGSLPTVEWTHTVGVQVILDDLPLGGVFLTRHAKPFTDAERELLVIAESQLDSAIIQARTIWRLAQRNRELEAIYQIDRLRDSHSTENDLINGFTAILIEYFKAELCMIILSHIDTGELIVRGVVGKNNLPPNALNIIRDLTGTIQLPQVIPTPVGLDQLTLLAAPLIVSGVRLGAIVVGRPQTFTVSDQRLIFAMTSQIDSAFVYSRVNQQLQQRNQELEVIYRIDKIRDEEVDFDAMLQRVLVEICRAVSSEVGYLMLFSEENEEQLELKASTIEGLLTSPAYFDVISRVSRQALRTGKLVHSNRSDGPVRSIIAIPLILATKVIGVFGTANSTNPRGFNEEDRRMLSAITSQVDTAVFERLERRRMRRVLSRSVDPKVIDRMLSQTNLSLLTGERVELSVVFADLRGSTEWAERTDPEQIVYTLNRFLGSMTDVIFAYGGTLDKFVGDEVIALFGSPVSMEDHALRAVQAALEMQRVHDKLVNEMATRNIELPMMGVGVSTGEVIAGEIGSPVRTDFTALGRPVNLGSRLCSTAPGGKIYISDATRHKIEPIVEVAPVEPVVLKGIGAVPIYELLGLRGN